MFCLNPIIKSPMLSALVAGCGTMIYFSLMSYSPNLPPALLCSIGVAYVVYFMMGGKVLCDETEAPAPPVPPALPMVPPAQSPQAPPAPTGPEPIMETYMPYRL
jgi:hypothetical protein